MLKGIPTVLGPELLKTLCEMGHGDEIVIADGNFPCNTFNRKVIRADGHGTEELLKAILQLFPLDDTCDCYAFSMATDDGTLPKIVKEYSEILKINGYLKKINEIERYAFYERATHAYCVLATGEKALYANLILKKGTV